MAEDSPYDAAWLVLGRHVLHDAYPWVRLSSEHVRLPNGVEISDFYRVEISPYVMIFPQLAAGEAMLVQHYKHGPQILSLELPAGYIEEAEPLQSAQRELREETGLYSDDWHFLGRYFIDGNRGCGWVYAYLARACTVVGHPQPESTELIRLVAKSLDEIYELWRNGHIPNVAASLIIGRALLELGYLRTT
jgi:ADP-ribose pyrophosphatase